MQIKKLLRVALPVIGALFLSLYIGTPVEAGWWENGVEQDPAQTLVDSLESGTVANNTTRLELEERRSMLNAFLNTAKISGYDSFFGSTFESVDDEVDVSLVTNWVYSAANDSYTIGPASSSFYAGYLADDNAANTTVADYVGSADGTSSLITSGIDQTGKLDGGLYQSSTLGWKTSFPTTLDDNWGDGYAFMGWIKFVATGGNGTKYRMLVTTRATSGNDRGMLMHYLPSTDSWACWGKDTDGTTMWNFSFVWDIDWTNWHHMAFCYDPAATTVTWWTNAAIATQVTSVAGLNVYPTDSDVFDWGSTDASYNEGDLGFDTLKFFSNSVDNAVVVADYNSGTGTTNDPIAAAFDITEPTNLEVYNTSWQGSTPGASEAICTLWAITNEVIDFDNDMRVWYSNDDGTNRTFFTNWTSQGILLEGELGETWYSTITITNGSSPKLGWIATNIAADAIEVLGIGVSANP